MTQDEIENFIYCEKYIVSRPKKKFYSDKQSPHIKRNDFKCESKDGILKFDVFIRINEIFNDKFSIGLVFRYKGQEIHLVRFNGGHFHKNKHINNKTFNSFHIHIANDKQMEIGYSKKFDAVEADYISYDSALISFCNFCNIIDTDDLLGIEEKRNQYTIFDFLKEGNYD